MKDLSSRLVGQDTGQDAGQDAGRTGGFSLPLHRVHMRPIAALHVLLFPGFECA